MRGSSDQQPEEFRLRTLKTLLKLYPVFRRFLKDRSSAKKENNSNWDHRREINGRKAVTAFIELGPTFIKLGQILSARSDILPKEYLAAFEELQDRVPPSPFSEVKQLIERNTGKIEDVFESFDRNAISGASLGQVYRAIYRGKPVAVKVNRPEIRETVQRDLIILERLLRLGKKRMDKFLYMSLLNIVNDFSSRIFDEIDYTKEAHNLKRIRDNLAKRGEDIIIPSVIEELSGKEVLVMEYIEGIKITNVTELAKMDFDLKKLAMRVDLLFLRMLLRDDIFHADPHPGNISVAQNGQLILYDFGMVGSLDESTRSQLLKLYAGLAEMDPDLVIDALLEMKALSPAANRGVIRRAMELTIAEVSGKRVEQRDVQEVFEIANNVIFEFPFRLPQSLVLYMRLSSILEGICQTLDPEFKFIRVLREILYNEGLLEEFYRNQLFNFVKKSVMSIERGVEIIPLLKRRLDEIEPGRSNETRNINPLTIYLGFGLVALAFMYRYFPLYSLVLMGADFVAFILSLRKRKG